MDAVLVRRCHGSRALDTFTTDLHEVREEDVEEWQEEDSAEAQGQGDIGDQRRPGADAHWATTTGGNAAYCVLVVQALK